MILSDLEREGWSGTVLGKLNGMACVDYSVVGTVNKHNFAADARHTARDFSAERVERAFISKICLERLY